MLAEKGEPTQGQSPPKRKSRFWSRLRRVLIWGITIVLALFFLFQLPFFQNWLAARVINSISKTLNTTVTLDHVRLAWLDELSLEGLFIEDKYR
ncbi:MAG: hypothetical protein AAFU67_18990, partial [Bacteroidota bacterium]